MYVVHATYVMYAVCAMHAVYEMYVMYAMCEMHAMCAMYVVSLMKFCPSACLAVCLHAMQRTV